MIGEGPEHLSRLTQRMTMCSGSQSSSACMLYAWLSVPGLSQVTDRIDELVMGQHIDVNTARIYITGLGPQACWDKPSRSSAA